MDRIDRVCGVIISILCFVFICIIIGGIINLYDNIFVEPTATDKANQICKASGFDFYESFERIGILSKEPIAITCKYVEQYRKVDLNQPLVQVNK